MSVPPAADPKTAAAAPAAAKSAKDAEQARSFEPKIRGESKYDRVTSMLMAVVVGVTLVVAWLGLIYFTNQAYAARVTAPLEIVDVGGGGGSPDGEAGSTEAIDVPGATAAEQASNATEESASDLRDPTVETTASATIDPSAVASDEMGDVDTSRAMTGNGMVSTGPRHSKFGTGGPALGMGGHGDGIGREQRWSIIYPQGQTPDEYAKQLDALNVELAVSAGQTTLDYVSHFSAATPTHRVGPVRSDTRLWFLWQSSTRKANDAALLKKAGITVGDKPIFQFYPKQVEDTLARLEVQYRGRNPGEIKVTRFQVTPQGALQWLSCPRRRSNSRTGFSRWHPSLPPKPCPRFSGVSIKTLKFVSYRRDSARASPGGLAASSFSHRRYAPQTGLAWRHSKSTTAKVMLSMSRSGVSTWLFLAPIPSATSCCPTPRRCRSTGGSGTARGSSRSRRFRNRSRSSSTARKSSRRSSWSAMKCGSARIAFF